MTTSVLFRPGTRSDRLSNDMRTLLFGVVCIIAMLAMGKGIPLLITSRRATTGQLRMVRSELAQDSEIIAGRSGVTKSLDKTSTAFLGLSPAFLKGSSASQAAAGLASVIADAADANGVHVASLQPEVDSVTKSLIVPVIVRISATGDVRGVSGMLRDLESGVPLVDIRQVTIAQSDPTATSERMESLHVDLTVRGLYRRVPGSSDDQVDQ